MNLPLEKNMCNDITIEMNDGFKLNAKHFKSEQCDKLIIIASAMAVPSRKYEKFAKQGNPEAQAYLGYFYEFK